MNRFFPYFVGFRYSRSKKRHFFISLISFISVIGIALGVCVLITVLSVMNGFDEEIENRIFDFAPQILIIKDNFSINAVNNLENNVIKAVPNIVAVAPYLIGQGVIKTKEFKPVFVHGIIPEKEKFVSNISNRMIEGSVDNLVKGKFNVLINAKVASELELSVGDKFLVMVPVVNVNPISNLLRYKRFTISGVFSADVGAGDDYHIYVNIYDSQNLFQVNNNITGLRLKTTNLYMAPQIANVLKNKLSEEYYVTDWTNDFGSYLRAIQLEKTMMLLILVLLIVIAVFNLVSSLIMLVNEKNMDIAILRTMGAKSFTILKIFIIQGSVTGLIGTIIGLISGVILSSNVSKVVDVIISFANLKSMLASVYLVDHLPSKILTSDLIVICSISLSLSLIATIYPAWRASRLHPALILRYE